MTFKKISCILISMLILLIGSYLYIVSHKKVILDEPVIVCTTTIIADTVKNLTQQTPASIKILMGPGVDPHTYKPIEQDVITIASAQIIFYNGLHLEARMAELFEQMQHSITTKAITQDIPNNKLIFSQEFQAYPDPHVWFDPTLWIYAVQTITSTLIAKFPEYTATYEKNKSEYISKIQNMYQDTYHQMLAIPPKKRLLITGHDAFSYFARAYNCKVISLQGISTASEAGTGDVQHLINVIVDHNITTIFAETSIPTRNMQALVQGAQAYGLHVKLGEELCADSLGSLNTATGTYLGMLESNVHHIVDGLK